MADKTIGNIVMTKQPYEYIGVKYALFLHLYSPIKDVLKFQNILEDRLNEFEFGRTVIETKKTNKAFPNDDLWRAYQAVEKSDIPEEKYIVYLLLKKEKEKEYFEEELETILKEEKVVRKNSLFQIYLKQVKAFPCERKKVTKIPIKRSIFDSLLEKQKETKPTHKKGGDE